MDNSTDKPATPSALDKVAAALTALGQGTAAAIAERASVGYSTATKRLRDLAEANQAEPLRADDGPTIWRHVAGTATRTNRDDPPATTIDADRETPEALTATDGDTDGTRAPDEALAQAQEMGAAVTASPDAESTGIPPDDEVRPTPDDEPDPPTLKDPAAQTGSVSSDPAITEAEAGEACPADADGPDAVAPPVEADPQPSSEAAVSNDSVASSSPAESPDGSSGGTPRRSKGSLRGAILDVLEAHPEQPFKTSQLCKAIDQANTGTDAAKASAGAVVNAVHKLVTAGVAVQVADKPATFQLAPTTR